MLKTVLLENINKSIFNLKIRKKLVDVSFVTFTPLLTELKKSEIV